MTVEEILAALQAILDEAGESELSDEQVARYEELEGKLESAQKNDKIRKRHAELNLPATALVTGAAPKKDNTLERAFADYLRTGKENADLVELRAQGVGTDSAGGYTVPEGFRTKLVDVMKEFGGLANVVETVTTDSGNAYPYPTVNDTANLGEIVAEGGTFAAGADMTFGTVSLGAYKYMAGGAGNLPLRLSVELLQDSAFDVEALVARKLGERIARIQAQHIVTGTGTGQPLGIVTGLTGVETGQNTGLEYDDLVNFIHSVDPAYRANARWAFNDQSLATIKKIKDSNGDPIWRPDSADMGTDLGGGTLMGYPVTIDQAFADYDPDSQTVNWGVFGNLSEGYVIRRVRDVQVLVNPYNRMANGQVEFTAWARMDATQQNTAAYKALTGFVA